VRRGELQVPPSRRNLEAALAEVRELKGMLPICAWCGRVRDDQGYWDRLETYITVHTRTTLTHGLCPQCARTAFAEVPAGPEGQEPSSGG